MFKKKNKNNIMKRRLLCNRWQTPDGTILESVHTHDYVSHTDKNGDYYFVDGGCDYVRMSVNDEPMKDLSVYTDSRYNEIRENYKRGTFDSEGHRIWVPMMNMSDQHLLASIIYNMRRKDSPDGIDISSYLYAKELVYRFNKDFMVCEYGYTEENIKKEPATMTYPMNMPDGARRGELGGVMSFDEVMDVLEKYNDTKIDHTYELYKALMNFMDMFEKNNENN